MHHDAIEEKVCKTFTFEFDVLFSVLPLLDASIGMIGLWIQCHSHTSMIRRQL